MQTHAHPGRHLSIINLSTNLHIYIYLSTYLPINRLSFYLYLYKNLSHIYVHGRQNTHLHTYVCTASVLSGFSEYEIDYIFLQWTNGLRESQHVTIVSRENFDIITFISWVCLLLCKSKRGRDMYLRAIP